MFGLVLVHHEQVISRTALVKTQLLCFYICVKKRKAPQGPDQLDASSYLPKNPIPLGMEICKRSRSGLLKHCQKKWL